MPGGKAGKAHLGPSRLSIVRDHVRRVLSEVCPGLRVQGLCKPIAIAGWDSHAILMLGLFDSVYGPLHSLSPLGMEGDCY
jgi:hypothetical protein